MIATHNIKVNGRWYRAGEEYPDGQPKKAEEPVKNADIVKTVEEQDPAKEEVKTEKPKTSTRRRTTK